MKVVLVNVLLALTVKTSESNIFQGIEKRPWQDKIKLENLIPTAIKTNKIIRHSDFQKVCKGTLSNCLLDLDKAAGELLFQTAKAMHAPFNNAMQKYTNLAFKLINASEIENRKLDTSDLVKFLSLKRAKGHCALELLYRCNMHEESFFNLYLLFSDLQNIFVSSFGEPYTNEKLLILLEMKTKMSRVTSKFDTFDDLKNSLDNCRQTIDTLSTSVCEISDGWFHPEKLKWKNLMYREQKGENLDTDIIIYKHATKIRQKELGISQFTENWDISIRTENGFFLLLAFNSQIVRAVLVTIAENAVYFISYIFDTFDKLVNSLSEKSNNLSKDMQNKIVELVTEKVSAFLVAVQTLLELFLQRRGIQVSLEDDPLVDITIILNRLCNIDGNNIKAINGTNDYLRKNLPLVASKLNIKIKRPQINGADMRDGLNYLVSESIKSVLSIKHIFE